MGYKRKLFNDKSIVAAAAVGVMAVSAIVGGVMLGSGDDRDNKAIVDLDEGMEDDLLVEQQSDKEVSDDKNIVAENIKNGTPSEEEDDQQSDNKDGDDKTNTDDGEEQSSELTNQLDTSENDADNDDDESENQETENDDDSESANVGTGIMGLNFSADSTLIWPVEGSVIIDFDMENTVYFATLDLYKCSDAVCVQAAVDTPVYAGSACSIESIEYDSEIGNNVTVSLGNGYMLTYGQLKDVQVEAGQILEEGDLIGYVGNPTKYYTVEGAHLYMKMTHDGVAVDPLDYLNY